MKSVLASRRAFVAAMLYALAMSTYFGYVWYNSKPEYHGMNWILAGLLSFPGLYGVSLVKVELSNQVTVGIALAINTVLLCLFVTVCERLLEGPRIHGRR
ncbi:MAG TPA: hypothetical protein VGL53_17970 [Bryobacteraceae bacterium]